MDSEISGLADRHAFLKLGNHVAGFSFAVSTISPPRRPRSCRDPLEDDDLAFDPKTLREEAAEVR